MLTNPQIIPNSFAIKRFVGVGNIEAQLAQNPSAKIFREIVITVGKHNVAIELASVTKEAANGGYRNDGINKVSIQVSADAFFTQDESQFVDGVLGAEPYVVLNKLLAIRRELINSREAVETVIDLMDKV